MQPFQPPFRGMQSHGSNNCFPQQVLFPPPPGPMIAGNFGSSFNHLFPCASGAQPQVPSRCHASSNQSSIMPFSLDNTSMNFGNSHANVMSIPGRPPLHPAPFPGVITNHQHLTHAFPQTVHQMGFVPLGHLSGVQQNFNQIAAFQPPCWQFGSQQPSFGVNQNLHGQNFFQGPITCLSQMPQMIDTAPAAGQLPDSSGPENCGNSNVNMSNLNFANDAKKNMAPNPNMFLAHVVDQNAMKVPPGPGQHSQDTASSQSQGNTGIQNFRNGPQGSIERYSPKFQRYQPQHSGNPRGKFSKNHRNGWKGHQSGAGKSNLMKCNKNPMQERKRFTSLLSYTDEEIRKWREERKRNFPTKLNVEKKSNHHVNHEDSKMRRQQLKQILAKQAELGVEVAELPPEYLSDSENQVDRNREDRRSHHKSGRFRNKFNRRGRDSRDDMQTKRQKLGQETAHEVLTSTRKPTLLEKLLSADIKRDKSHLLQVFRFMVLNSFFKDWPAKLGVLPLVRVRDGSGTEDIAKGNFVLQGDNAVSKVENVVNGDCDLEDVEQQGEPTESDFEGEEMADGGEKDLEEVGIGNIEGEEGEITD
ncbi:hypothetical protein H6P81_020162 [Aristolochia fimbriata]|uniref:FMR1-interacting protein 1 conserved domain-containing protein n=1 Tax=Aristolochia fimbriata TaxID=158543 RepID=A0AAV7DWX7_ARIFI|nr:hypothetical protein H6P81_020162 [Aristolochia fimbriata]